MSKEEKNAKLEKEALEQLDTFFDDKLSMMMATVSEEGEPFCSYTPYVEDEDHNYYIYISGSVPHSANMSANGKVSIMMIEDESKCEHIYARKRFYAQATAEAFSPNDERTEAINELFAKKFDSKVKYFFKMPDFRIYKITPKDGNLVLGFGAAYKVGGDRKSMGLKSVGHNANNGGHK